MTARFALEPAGADEAPVVVGDYDEINGDVTYDTAYNFGGLTSSIRFTNDDGTIATAEQHLVSPVTVGYMTRVWRLGTFTSGSFATLQRLRSGSTSLAEVRFNSSGQLILRDSATATNLATITVGLADSLRYEWDVNGATQSWRVYLDPESTTPDGEFGPFAYSGGAWDRVIDGIGTSAGWTQAWLLYADDDDTAPSGLASLGGTELAEGVHQFAVIGGVETLLSTEIA